MILWNTEAQGTEGWLAARRGRITGSQFKTTRDRLKNGEYSAKAKLYAMDVARERIGGRAGDVFVNAAMKFGTEQEPFARMAYEATTGSIVTEVGFAYTDDGKFGCSVDGLVGNDGMVEIKTMVSSDTLFRAVVDEDISDYIDQCNGAMWLLGLNWCDLILWAPDLPAGNLTGIRIDRDDNIIEALEADLIAFDRLVCKYEAKLRAKVLSGELDLLAPAAVLAPTF